MALRERTRRLLTTFLFACFGPGLLCFVGYRLYWRTTTEALDLERARLSIATRLDVDFVGREFPFPGVRRFVGLTLSSPETGETAFFCPEIYATREKNVAALTEFARAFDERAGRGAADDGSYDSSESFETLLFSRQYDDRPLDAFTLIVAPTIYCRDSHISDVKKCFCNAFLKRPGTGAFFESRRAVCLVVERIVFQDDATFEATRRDFVASDERTSRDDLRDMFRAASATPKRGDAAFEATRRETIAFSSEEPIVEKFRALFVVAPDVKRFETQFELAKISAGRSIFISFEARRGSETSSPGASRFEFDGVRSPTPGKFAARFFPIFSVSSDESWFSGRVVASDAPEFGADVFGPPSTLPSSSVASNANADEPPFLQSPESVWTTRLDDCRFYGVDVATLADKLELPCFAGSVSEFCVRDGAIRRGVFLGSGFLKILKGSIPQSILSRACAAKRLEVSPPSTLSLRFADDAVPFAEFESLFEARRDGIAFDSRYPNKIIAYYRGVDVEYGVFLPKDAAGRIVSYSEAVASLLGTENVRDFWSPFFREALNHLPIDSAASVSTEPPTESEERREISVPFH